MARIGAILLLATVLGAVIAEDCNWLDAMDVNPDLGAIQEILRSTKVLPPDTNEKATIILPNLPAFITFLLDQGTTAEELTAALDASPEFRAKIDSVLMTHVLPMAKLTLEEIAAESPFPSAASQILDSGNYDITVSEDLGTIKAGDTEANVLETIDLCGMPGFIIDQVLVAVPMDEIGLTKHDMIDALFANLTSIAE